MERKNSSKSRILKAAMQLFSEHGVEPVSVSELADKAGVSRGTIYTHYPSMEALYKELAGMLEVEMSKRIDATFALIDHPVERMAVAIRLTIRRAQEEPDWGRFLLRFGLNDSVIREVLGASALRDLSDGLNNGDYRLDGDQITMALSSIGGSTLGAVYFVLEGLAGWRKAGSDTAEFVLRGFGVPQDIAKEISQRELPDLATTEQ
ncbi:MAG: helix-turn-helix domain containing protein [Gammaproteobacteria bacterium]|nr:helix-turn-helix domain containing protein [Gammaproteobacteria bacterium]